MSSTVYPQHERDGRDGDWLPPRVSKRTDPADAAISVATAAMMWATVRNHVD
jgi:hypothetical protein